MPMPITLAHRLVKRQASTQRPDAKSQVTVKYVNNQPAGIDAVVLSTQHAPGVKYAPSRKA